MYAHISIHTHGHLRLGFLDYLDFWCFCLKFGALGLGFGFRFLTLLIPACKPMLLGVCVYVCRSVCMYVCIYVCMYALYVCMYVYIQNLNLFEPPPPPPPQHMGNSEKKNKRAQESLV